MTRPAAVGPQDMLRAYVRATKEIMSRPGVPSVDASAGTMYPNGGYEGYQVFVRLVRYTDMAAKLHAMAEAAERAEADA